MSEPAHESGGRPTGLVVTTLLALVLAAALVATLPVRVGLAVIAVLVVAAVGAAAVALQGLVASLQGLVASSRATSEQVDAVAEQVDAVARRTMRTARRVKVVEAEAQVRARERAAEEARVAAAREAAKVDVAQDVTTITDRLVADLVWDGSQPHVVLALPGFDPASVFAGIRTAVLAAAHLAGELGLPLRVLVVEQARASHAEARAGLAELVRDHAGRPEVADALRLSSADARDPGGHHPRDVWVATYWTTAYAAQGLVRQGRLDRSRVVYLVQDFEPGFFPWGPLHAKALSTYEAGFTPLVNSSSLAGYLAHMTGRPVEEEAVFAPALDLEPVRRAAGRWRPDPAGRTRVLFYARPSKPRNMFATGVEALRLWAEGVPEGERALVRLAGEDIPDPVDLGARVEVERCGKLTYEAYYDLLAATDVGLALMLSPHPGHLALELPMAGIPTVTNDFAGHRHPWVSGLQVASVDVTSLAAGLATQAGRARALDAHVPGELVVPLGGTLGDAVAHVAAGLR